jgi:hypothetical protein
VKAVTRGRTALLLVAAALAACAPPETQRVRGGERGADIGNRSPVVEMHAGSVIYPDGRRAVQGAPCTGPLPPSRTPPRATSPLGHDPYVLEHMGEGGGVRPVIYRAPPDLARPAPWELAPTQPGPETGRGDVDEGGEPVDPADEAVAARAAPAAAASRAQDEAEPEGEGDAGDDEA